MSFCQCFSYKEHASDKSSRLNIGLCATSFPGLLPWERGWTLRNEITLRLKVINQGPKTPHSPQWICSLFPPPPALKQKTTRVFTGLAIMG